MNRLISDAVINNFKYSRPRVKTETIKEFINPSDVMITSSCLAGLLKEPSLILVKRIV